MKIMYCNIHWWIIHGLDFIVKEIAEKENLKVVELRYNKRLFSQGHIQILSAGIEDFLSLIYNARYVITNSFHGTIFSILFEKNFYTLKINGVNSRIENILNITELNNRCIENVSEIDLKKKIDFKNAKDKIEKEREHSQEFLRNVLKK